MIIFRIKYEIGITMIWVEHDMQLVGDLADRIVVLNFGTKIAEVKEMDRFRYRTRYFTDSGIIGSKEFVLVKYKQFKGYFSSKHKKKPKAVQGLEGIFSLKRLSENI